MSLLDMIDKSIEKAKQVQKEEKEQQTAAEKVESVQTVENQTEQPKKLEVKKVPYPEYLNYCHNYVFHVQATFYLIKAGLYAKIDELQIGYDTVKKELTIPLDGNQYYSINLAGKQVEVKEQLEKVIQELEGKAKTSNTIDTSDYMDFGQLEVTGIVVSRGKNFFLMTTEDFEQIRVILEDENFNPLEKLKCGDKVKCVGNLRKKFSKTLIARELTKEQ